MPLRVLAITPHCLGDGKSPNGGGGRYPFEFAKALAKFTPVTLVSFGPQRRRSHSGNMTYEVFERNRWSSAKNPVAVGPVIEMIGRHDIVHCFQYRYACSNFAALMAKGMRKRSVLTDLGGGALDLSRVMPYGQIFDGIAPISRFSERDLQLRDKPTVVLFGGGNIGTWPGRIGTRILYVGRIVPHKGIEVLIEAAESDLAVDIVGTPLNRRYFDYLRNIALKSDVTFHTGVDDQKLDEFYGSAAAIVLPSVSRDIYGKSYRRSELLGLTLLEGMLHGIPAVGSRVGGVSEVIEEGTTGFSFSERNAGELRSILLSLLGDEAFRCRIGRTAFERASVRFTWEAVAERAMSLYGDLL